jgi:hypothetical protein
MKKGWEHRLRRELNQRLFSPRLERILGILKEKPVKKITGEDRRALYVALKPIVHKAIRDKYKTELESNASKAFKLTAYSPRRRREAIKEKIRAYDSQKGIRFRRLIYTLWDNKRECLYVGQTKRGLPEIVAKRAGLYRQAVRLKIYSTGKKKLDRYEGIGYHVLTPKSKIKPRFNEIHTKNAKKKCPFCRTEDKIKKEICRALVLV